MEVSSPPQKRLQGATEGLDTSSTPPTVPVKQRDLVLPSPLNTPQRTIFKQRDHRLLPPLKIPRQTNRFPLQSFKPEQKDRLPPLSLTTRQTKYRQYSGEVYKSAQAPARQIENSRESSLSISDPTFLELIRSAASSGTDLVFRGDQSPTSSGSSASTIRELQPRTFVFDSRQDSGQQYYVYETLDLSWATKAMLNTLSESQWGDPVEPAEHGLLSTFREKFSVDENAPKLGQKIWADGFDVLIFTLSTRVGHKDRKHLRAFLPYKLRGTQGAAKEYFTASATYLRRKMAWIKVCNALDQRSANERLSKEFEDIAADFFNGCPVKEDYEAGHATFSAAPKPYILIFRGGDRTKVLQENPLASKTVALFLEDLVMANEMEKACLTKETYQAGLKVYRHQSHIDTSTKLNNARKSQEKYTYYYLMTETTPNPLPEGLKELIKTVADTSGPESDFTVLGDGGENSLHPKYTFEPVEAPNTPGNNSALNSVSLGPPSTVEGTSAAFSDISSASPGLDATAKKSSVHDSPVRPSQLIASTPKVAANDSNSNGPPTFSKALDQFNGGLQTTPHADKPNVTEVEGTISTPTVESSGSKKKFRGSKRNKRNKRKDTKKIEEPSSSRDNQDQDHATVSLEQPSETPPSLGIKVEPEARTHPDPENAATSKHDNEWSGLKTKVSHKSKSSKKEAWPVLPNTSNIAPPSNQAETTKLRNFKPEEYTMSSNIPTVEPEDGQTSGIIPATSHTTTLAAVENMTWDQTVRNLPPEEAEAIRVLSRESMHSVAPSGPRHAGNADHAVVDTPGTLSEHHPTDKLLTAVGKRQGQEIDEAPSARGTGLEWAAAELTSPTKFNSGWRHSSLPYRSPTPSHDDFDDSVEISSTRPRSNTTTILNPRVRAVQFGDLPVALPELNENKYAANSGHPSSPSHSVPEARSAYHEQGQYPGNVPGCIDDFPPAAGFANQPAMPFVAQIPISQPHHAPPMFMHPPYPPRDLLPPTSGHPVSHPNPHPDLYGLPMSGFTHPPPTMLSYHSDNSGHSGHITNHAHPVPVTADYPPNTHNGSGISSYNHQPVGQTSQQEGDCDESFTGLSRSDRSFETSSNLDQQPEQSTNAQGTDALAGYTCRCCFRGYFPSVQQPLYFCAGCGPTGAIRYCSVACLLADAYNHSLCCMQYPHYMRMDPHNMPDDLYEYERFYLAPVELRTEKETPERFRQRSFAMYCWHGPFPRILKAYALTHELPVGLQGCDVNEAFKKTGDYHIFRSEVSAAGKKFAPCEVICTLRLRNGDPMKEALNRALNACLIYLQPRVVKFLFRLLHHLILDLDTWSLMMPVLDQRMVHAEFIHQFSREFSFDAQAHAQDIDTFDLTEDWRLVRLDMEDLEMQFQVLRCWYRTKRGQWISGPLEPRDAYM